MRILVTGHLGYLGSVLVPRLRARGFEVTGVDADWYWRCNFGGSPEVIPSKRADVRQLSSNDLVGIDAIIHLAGLCNDPLGELNPELTLEINTTATLSLAEKARDAGVKRFVFASSCSNYGAAGEEEVSERSPLNPVTVYGRSKVLAEEGLSKLAGPDFSPLYLRNATVYGLSPRPRFDLVVNNMVAWAMHGGEVLLKSRGQAWRPLVHVEDVADAMIAALLCPRDALHDRAINIGDTQANHRIVDLANMIVQQIPGSRLKMLAGAEIDTRSYRVNCDQALRALPDWKPRRSIVEGVSSLCDALRVQGLRPQDFEGSRYARLKHLQYLLATGELNGKLLRNERRYNRANPA